MPNLVHSLDAAALACLADLYFNSSTSKNFYAIHDCFAVTASNVQNIMDFLELVYVKIYTENSYLRQFDQHIKDHIKKIYHKEFNDKTNIITVENLPEIAFPDINEVLEVTLNSKDIKGSSYLMH
jgi:DNA-directed RNA polymerase